MAQVQTAHKRDRVPNDDNDGDFELQEPQDLELPSHLDAEGDITMGNMPCFASLLTGISATTWNTAMDHLLDSLNLHPNLPTDELVPPEQVVLGMRIHLRALKQTHGAIMETLDLASQYGLDRMKQQYQERIDKVELHRDQLQNTLNMFGYQAAIGPMEAISQGQGPPPNGPRAGQQQHSGGSQGGHTERHNSSYNDNCNNSNSNSNTQPRMAEKVDRTGEGGVVGTFGNNDDLKAGNMHGLISRDIYDLAAGNMKNKTNGNQGEIITGDEDNFIHKICGSLGVKTR